MMKKTNKWAGVAIIAVLALGSAVNASADLLPINIFPRERVPDVSATFQLLGASLLAVAVLRRRVKSR
jgi:hypothetical protein